MIEIIGKSIVSKLSDWGIAEFNKDNYNEYELELIEVIKSSKKEFEEKFPIDYNGKIPFYQSQQLLEELLKFRFTQRLDEKQVEKALLDNEKIINPSEEQINEFFIIFDKHLKLSKKLSKLNIENNYKEEIFNISNNLSSLYSLMTEIKSNLESNDKQDELNDSEKKLLKTLLEFEGICKIAAARGEFECLWMPGYICDMQWGWERTPEEQRISGKTPGSRKDRLHWILIVKDLEAKGFLRNFDEAYYEMTDKGKRAAYVATYGEI